MCLAGSTIEYETVTNRRQVSRGIDLEYQSQSFRAEQLNTVRYFCFNAASPRSGQLQITTPAAYTPERRSKR
jgi:hypothetical protein